MSYPRQAFGRGRRRFLGAVGIAALLAACGAPPAPTAAPTTAPAAPTSPPTPPPAPTPPPTPPATPAPAGAPTAAAAPSPAVAPAAAASSAKAPVELRIHDWAQDPKDEFYGPLFARFEQEHPTIKLKREWFPRDDLHTKQLTLAGTGQLGDTVRISLGGAATGELINKGVIQSLTPFINKDARWRENDQRQFWPSNIKNYTFKGEQWGYPVVGHPGQVLHYVNLDLVARAGARVPVEDGNWTQDQAIEAYQKLTRSDARATTWGILPAVGQEGAVGVLRAFGGDYFSEDGTKCLVGTPESIRGIEWLGDLWNKHKVADRYDPKANPNELFPGQAMAIYVSTAGGVGLQTRQVGDKFKWTVLPPPIGPIGRHATQVSADGYALARQTRYPDEAWEVVKLYASKEHGLKRFVYGFGSPGSRYDIWTDPEFKRNFPPLGGLIYDKLINPAKAPPLGVWHFPANGRFIEAITAINGILEEVWLGNRKPAEAAAAAQTAGQAVVEKPPV